MSPDLSWTLSPAVIVAVALAGLLYARRWRQVRSSGDPRARAQAPVWKLCCFAGALALVLAALVSPLDALADQLLFAHMAQHIVLLDLVPILAIAALGKVLLRPVTRTVSALERRAGAFGHPAFAVLLYVGVIWAWHVPAAYDAAVEHSTLHVLEHASFLAAGLLYWWHLLSPIRARLRLDGMGPVAYMATSKLFAGALGMGLAFAPSVLYPYYSHQPRVWGISALSDQSIAGLTMALTQSIVMGIALATLFIRALVESERAQQRRERYELSA